MMAYRHVRATMAGLAIAGVLIALIWVGAFRAPAVYYRLDTDRALIVAAQTGPLTWTAVTSVVETPTTVTVTVGRLGPPLSWFSYDATELLIILDNPLGDRAVVDGFTGKGIPRR